MVGEFTSTFQKQSCITQPQQRAGVIWHQVFAPGERTGQVSRSLGWGRGLTPTGMVTKASRQAGPLLSVGCHPHREPREPGSCTPGQECTVSPPTLQPLPYTSTPWAISHQVWGIFLLIASPPCCDNQAALLILLALSLFRKLYREELMEKSLGSTKC